MLVEIFLSPTTKHISDWPGSRALRSVVWNKKQVQKSHARNKLKWNAKRFNVLHSSVLWNPYARQNIFPKVDK